jgi:hypothetical protein
MVLANPTEVAACLASGIQEKKFLRFERIRYCVYSVLRPGSLIMLAHMRSVGLND